MSSHDENRVTYFGETDARNRQLRFGIKMHDRLKHVYAIGKTGMGKSTLLENMAIQDIQNGEGISFIDPHGKSAELLLDYIPEHRIKDVVYFAPFDMEYPVAFNVMEDVGADRRHLVANGLMSAFKKIWVDAWSARMEYILNNIMLALLEFPGSTLLGVNRMLADKEFRNKVVANITDPSVRSFWVDEYAKYTDKFAAEAAPSIQNKVGQFVSNPIVRNIIGQAKSTFDIRKMMDERKILIINLSKGRVGEANANLIGSMLVTKIYLAAMSRADLSEKDMKEAAPFYLYVDEFQSFANESFADILSEARKYKLSLTIAHQYIEQMPDEVRAAVFGNVGTMITFRVGVTDGEVLEKEFTPTFTQEDLVNLGKYQMYLKLMIDGVSSRPFSARGLPDAKKPDINYKDKIIATSREQFARPRAVVEEEIKGWHLQRFNDAPTLVQNKDARPVKPSGYPGAVASPQPTRPSSAGFSNKDRDRLVASSQAPHPHQMREENRKPTRSADSFKGLQGEQVPRPHSSAPKDPHQGGNKMVLADAIRKATLERENAVKEEIKIADDTKRKESETDLRQVISLSYLHNDTLKNDKNEKSAKPEQLNALRDLIADSKKPAPVADVENAAPKPTVDVPPPQPKVPPVVQPVVNHVPNKIREVPEDVLNTILNG